MSTLPPLPHKTLHLHPQDNVLVALQDLKKGEIVSFQGVGLILTADIPAKHKLTLRAFAEGENVVMYGVLVGKAARPIEAGGLITTANLRHAASGFGARKGHYSWSPPDVGHWKDAVFEGYRRADGQVGTRNYWLVVPLVFCENRDILILKDAFLKSLGYAQPDVYRDQLHQLIHFYQANGHTDGFEYEKKSLPAPAERLFQNVDGVKFLTHESGCGGTREDSNNLCALIAGYCVNPNVAGVTVLSLGCQHAQIGVLEEKIAEKDAAFQKPLLIYERQKWPSEYEMLSQAVRQTFDGLVEMNKLRREPAQLSKLTVGVKCGGSDGFSGISANPAVGYAADLLVALGGKVLMAEFPELCGVEQELIDRCADDATAQRFSYLMKEYAARAQAAGSGFDMNPSPGNIRDGLITDAMKSAGAAKKGGSSPIVDAVGYGGYAAKPGLSLICTPGNDVESTSGMAGAGATLQLFTTGLGTATGNPISPVVKLSTNNALAERLTDVVDINCGPIITGEKTVEEMGEEILAYIVGLASGEYDTKAMNLGQDDFIFWRRGVSL